MHSLPLHSDGRLVAHFARRMHKLVNFARRMHKLVNFARRMHKLVNFARRMHKLVNFLAGCISASDVSASEVCYG